MRSVELTQRRDNSMATALNRQPGRGGNAHLFPGGQHIGGGNANLLHAYQHIREGYSPVKKFFISLYSYILPLLALYSVGVAPLDLSILHIKAASPAKIVGYFTDVIFLGDLLCTIFIIVYHQQPKKISIWWYIILDTIAILFAMVYAISISVIGSPKMRVQVAIACNCIRLLRVVRMRHVNDTFARFERGKRFNYFWVRCVRLICVTLLALHYEGCVFNAFVGPSIYEGSSLVSYVNAVYWSTATATTVGYGDVHAMSTGEQIFSIFAMLLNLGLGCYTIGNFTQLMVDRSGQTKYYRDAETSIIDYLARNNIPSEVEDTMLSLLREDFKVGNMYKMDLMNKLPAAMSAQINKHVFDAPFEKVYLFRKTSRIFRTQLLTLMKPEYYPPEEYIISQNDRPSRFYIVVSGMVSLITCIDGDEQVPMTMTSGDVFGEVGIMCRIPQPHSFQTVGLTHLLGIDRQEFLSVVRTHFSDGEILIENFIQMSIELPHIFPPRETLQQLGHAYVLVDLHFLAAQGNLKLLKIVLISGQDPHIADETGRTPLHVAASKGFDRCVQLLLNHGAQPDFKDNEGHSPVILAQRGNHTSTANILLNHSGTRGSLLSHVGTSSNVWRMNNSNEGLFTEGMLNMF